MDFMLCADSACSESELPFHCAISSISLTVYFVSGVVKTSLHAPSDMCIHATGLQLQPYMHSLH